MVSNAADHRIADWSSQRDCVKTISAEAELARPERDDSWAQSVRDLDIGECPDIRREWFRPAEQADVPAARRRITLK